MRFRSLFPVAERLRFLFWRLSGRRFPITLRTKRFGRLAFRPQSRLAKDYGTAYEVFVHETYGNDETGVRSVVDVGCNVGYAMLYLARAFPDARIWCFEPFQEHCERAEQLAGINGLEERVEIIQAAACSRDGTARFVNAGTSSKLAQDGTIEVATIDFLRWAEENGPIDFLKLDIEGGEYEILDDPRFPAIAARYIALEWHNNTEHADGRRDCEEALRRSGYTIVKSFSGTMSGTGILHARRDR